MRKAAWHFVTVTVEQATEINISIISKLFITGQGELIADCTYNQGSRR